jgi:hypothetical protein
MLRVETHCTTPGSTYDSSIILTCRSHPIRPLFQLRIAFVAHLVFDFAKLTEFLLRIILAVNCGYGTNGWRSSAFTKEFMAMTCMIWGSCLSEYLFAFLHDTHGTHVYLAAHHSACLGNTRYWTDYSFPFFATSTHAAHHRLYSKLLNPGWAILSFLTTLAHAAHYSTGCWNYNFQFEFFWTVQKPILIRQRYCACLRR